MTAFTYENKAIFEPLDLANHELHRSTLQFDIFGLFIGKKQELKQELGLNRSASLRQHKAYRPNAILLVLAVGADQTIILGDARQRLNDCAGLYLKLFVNGGSRGWRLDYNLDGHAIRSSWEPTHRRARAWRA